MEAPGEGGGSDPPWVPAPDTSLDEQAEMFAGIARSSPDAVVVSDPDGTIVWANPATATLFGWPVEELLGRDATSLIDPADRERVRLGLGELREGQIRELRFETTSLSKQGGARVPLRVDVTAVRDSHGRARELVAFARNLRELREAERLLARQEAFFRGLNREASDVTLVTDLDGNLVYVTPSVAQVLGYEPDEVLELLAASLVHADDLAGQEERRRRISEVPGTRDRGIVRIQDAGGRWRWFETTATNCVDDPDIGGVVVNLREVTPEIEATRALRESEARYRAIAETAQEGILAVSPEGDILFANRRLTEILGLSTDELHARGGAGLLAPTEPAEAARRLAGRRADAGPERHDVPYRHPDGRDRVLHVSAGALTAADGSVLGSLAMVSDVTEQRAAEETLRQQALHDPLTGLPNRLLFVDRLTTAAARQEREGGPGIAVLFLDLDAFKDVNDTHGHRTGDLTLVEVAGRLARAVRGTDTVARLGGDEFAVICERADADAAELVASRIQQSLKEPLDVDGHVLEVSMSIGVALSPPYDADDLLRLADLAMYRAKSAAGDGVVTYDEGLG